MKTFFGAVAVAGIMVASGLAMAQGAGGSSGTAGATGTTAGSSTSMQSATGTVGKLDRSSNTVTMQDGTRYRLSSGTDVSKVKEGDQVRIQYQMQGSDRLATAVMPATGSAGSSGTGAATGSGSTSGGLTSGSSGPPPKK